MVMKNYTNIGNVKKKIDFYLPATYMETICILYFKM